MGIAGIPWWTTDIGGFFGANISDPKFHELLIRWFQYDCFCPVMAASYAFPALSRFEMPTGWFVKLSLYLTFRHMGISLLLLIFAASYLLLLWQPMLAAIVPGAANVLLSKLIDPILDQHMPKKEG